MSGPQYNRDAVLEDLGFLADNGVGITEAATRSGFGNAKNLERWLRRIDQGELATRLTRQDPASIAPSRKEHHLGGRRAS